MDIPQNTSGGQAVLLTEGPDQCVWVRRCHGLGNVICLLPVLDRLYQQRYAVNMITQGNWLEAFSVLRAEFNWYDCRQDGLDDDEVVDLDELTRHCRPSEHRTDEFGRLLAVEPPFGTPRIKAPVSWLRPYEHLRGAVVFAPEGGHPSRTWPTEQAGRLKSSLQENGLGQKLVLAGTDPTVKIPCDVDTRGQLQLMELIGLLAVAGAVVTMDSAVLHIAAALHTPTVAVFGGVDPAYRIRPQQPAVVIQANIPCCPCNKQETCQERFNCIKSVTPQDIAQAMPMAINAERMTVYKVNCLSNKSLTQVF